MASVDVPAATAPPLRRPGLRREIGFIGLLWASTGSIIGSGWLFGAQGALATAGPAAIISWAIGGVAIIAPLSFAVANLLMLWSGWTTDYKLGIAILIGYAILVANRLLKLNPIVPELNWRSASWLPVYLVGMGLIVYLSDFGPLKNPVFPLWWDMFAVAVFSLGIYAWAQRVALPT
jgi:amino acid transporter